MKCILYTTKTKILNEHNNIYFEVILRIKKLNLYNNQEFQ